MIATGGTSNHEGLSFASGGGPFLFAERFEYDGYGIFFATAKHLLG